MTCSILHISRNASGYDVSRTYALWDTVLFRPYRMALWRVTHPFVWWNRMDHMWGVTTLEGSEKIGTPGWSFNKEDFPMYPKCTDNANSGRYNEFWGLHVIFSSKIIGTYTSHPPQMNFLWYVTIHQKTSRFGPCDMWIQVWAKSGRTWFLIVCPE